MHLVPFLILLSLVGAGSSVPLRAQPAPDPQALDRLVAAAEAKQSNALFVHQHGRPVREAFFGTKDRRIYLFSVTKLFAGLAVGLAWDQGLLASIEEPLTRFFPEAPHSPEHARIRIRHLLQHTSGILTTPGSKDIYPERDFVKFALESPVITPPGEVYQYNNRAINLVSGIIRKVSGRSLEEFLVEHLFKPLDIQDYKFGRDRAGNTWAMDGLELKVSDLVKVGTVLADRGRWQGRPIVSERWLDVAMQGNLIRLHRSAPAGLGLFSIDVDGGVVIPAATVAVLARSGLDPAIASRLHPFADRTFATASALGTELQAAFPVAELESIAAAAGQAMQPLYIKPKGRRLVHHDGEFGVILVALPGTGIAIARTIDEKRGRGKPNGFEEIYSLAAQLLPPAPAP